MVLHCHGAKVDLKAWSTTTTQLRDPLKNVSTFAIKRAPKIGENEPLECLKSLLGAFFHTRNYVCIIFLWTLTRSRAHYLSRNVWYSGTSCLFYNPFVCFMLLQRIIACRKTCQEKLLRNSLQQFVRICCIAWTKPQLMKLICIKSFSCHTSLPGTLLRTTWKSSC